MDKNIVIFFFDEQGRRIPVEFDDHFPLIFDLTHDYFVKVAPGLKEKELYALYQGKEFLVWPTNPDKNVWMSRFVRTKSMADKIGQKLLEVKPSPVVEQKNEEININNDVKLFVHDVLSNINTKSNPALIKAIAELLEFFH